MLITDAERVFGGRKGIAKALSACEYRSVSAVYQWKFGVPIAAARKLAELSNGALSVDKTVYDENWRVVRSRESA
jgi:hypothetical protein